MNLYFLVEGKTEMELYPKWLTYLLPQYQRVDLYNQVVVNNYYIASGDGYPAMKDKGYIKNTIIDINRYGNYDYLIIVIDGDKGTKEGIENYLVENEIVLHNCQLEIIIQHVCIETWLMGNCAAYPKDVTKNKSFLKYHEHYNVSQLDPELMRKPTYLQHIQSLGKYHFIYLVEMLKLTHRYSKDNATNVNSQVYFEEIKKRTINENTHLNSFQTFLSLCEKINIHE